MDTKRVSVTITIEMDNTFTELAKKKNISKDKLIGSMLVEHLQLVESGVSVSELFGDLQKLNNERSQMLCEIEKLKNSTPPKIHNERGAGRKRSIQDTEIWKIKDMYEEYGMSMRSIARETGFSLGTISNVINNY